MSPARRGHQVLAFALAGSVVTVRCHGPADAAWLEANLSPSFVGGRASDVGTRITFARDDRAHAKLMRLGAALGSERIPCFALDSEIVAHPRWREAGSETIIHDDEFGVFYRVSKDGRRIRVIAPPGRPWARVAVFRIVREVLTGALRRQGGILIHAAGLSVGGQGIVVAGPKHAGKTSLLLHALGDPRTLLLANDRLAASRCDHGYVAQGVPTIVNVRSGTFGRLGLAHLEAGLSPAWCGPAEGRKHAGAPTRSPDGHLVMSPAQLAVAMGVSRTAGAPIAAVVLPSIHQGQGGIALRRLEVSEAVPLLQAARPGSGATLFNGAPIAEPSSLAALAEAVPCLRCEIGSDAYTTVAPTRLVDMILDHVRPRVRIGSANGSGTVVVMPAAGESDGLAERVRRIAESPGVARILVVGRSDPDVLGHDMGAAEDRLLFVSAENAGIEVLAAAEGRTVAFLPVPSPDMVAAARDLDPAAADIMPLASGVTLPTGAFRDARDVPLGWALSARAASQLLPNLDAPRDWTLARLYALAQANPDGFRWRSGPLAGAPAPAATRPATLGRRSRVLAIIPHFACEEWLAEALRSLSRQTRPPDAIAVVDDGSTTPPRDICAGFPGVTLYGSPMNVGPYRLVHSLVATTDFDALLFQDADDWSMADRLALLLAEAERTGAELIGTQELRQGDADRRFQVATYPTDVNAACVDHPHHALLHPTSLMATSLLARLGGLAAGLRYSGDTEFLFRAVFAARVANLPMLGYVRRDRPGSLTSAPATGLASPQRLDLLGRLIERGRQNAERRRKGDAPVLSPYAVADPISLRRITGPEIRIARSRPWPRVNRPADTSRVLLAVGPR